jgi:hypothetical protein
MKWDEIIVQAKKSVDECIENSHKVLDCYGPILKRFPYPIHPSILALYIWHESNNQRWALTKYPEFGLAMATCKYKIDDEVSRHNFDPADSVSHLWGIQQSFAEGIPVVSRHLVNYGYVSLSSLSVPDQIVLLLAPRIYGYGCLKQLLKKSFTNKYARRPIIAITEMLSNDDNKVKCGVQSSDVVKLRWAWGTTMVLRAEEVGIGNPFDKLQPPIVRTPDILPVPRGFYDDIEGFARKAKREGAKCAGSW